MVKRASSSSTRTREHEPMPGTESELTSLPSEDESLPPKKKRRRGSNIKSTEVDAEFESSSKSKKPRKPRAPKPEPVYAIPDVERLETTFKGRLGYACMNTILRNKKPASEAVFCARTCRLDSLEKNGMQWVKDIGMKNMANMLDIIQWNEDNNIKFMRLSSTVYPFASHMKHGYSLLSDPDILLGMQKVGALANKYGHRITTHPGQFTQLGSPTASIIASSIRELEYHDEMLTGMGIGKDGVCIVHGGGVYGDKEKTLGRIKNTIKQGIEQDGVLKGWRRRLVLENDELCYTAEDLLPLCEELNIPFVFDYHHDALNPSSIPPATIIARANAIFTMRGIKPKQHLSEARPGAVSVMERRAHSDRVKKLPTDLPDDMDLMIEAKDKEQAVLELHRIYNLHPVKPESLRPPAENISMHTNGRKSSKRAKAKKATNAEEAAQLIEVEDVLADDEDVCEDEAVPVDSEDAYKPSMKARDGERAKNPKKRTTTRSSKKDQAKPASATKKMVDEVIDEVIARKTVGRMSKLQTQHQPHI